MSQKKQKKKNDVENSRGQAERKSHVNGEPREGIGKDCVVIYS